MVMGISLSDWEDYTLLMELVFFLPCHRKFHFVFYELFP